MTDFILFFFLDVCLVLLVSVLLFLWGFFLGGECKGLWESETAVSTLFSIKLVAGLVRRPNEK